MFTHMLSEKKKAMSTDPRNAASVLRLHFRDCIVNGCDASLLLDDTPTMLGEKHSLENKVIDEAKAAVEKICPGVVSCADILVMASRDAVVLSGGITWDVKLGRKDSLTASQKGRGRNHTKCTFKCNFSHRPFQEIQSLSPRPCGHGRFSHNWQSRWPPRLYNYEGIPGMSDPTLDPKYKQTLEKICPLTGDQNVTLSLDATPQLFDNQYFKDLVAGKGFLHSDQTLYSNPLTREFVLLYSKDQQRFFEDFVRVMHNLGDIPGGPGEIRKNCRVVNAH
ncbi:hem peroxidase [Dillenia turbinata]|uniref:peroxidase n=1 Tax=Dillenia turbinata TaxID=194707 RepID=A0AAN8Z7G9_9MAGN